MDEIIHDGISRRTFIELIGFSAAATIAGCSVPEQKTVPYLKKPVELTPGVASWYASTCGGCSAACGLLVKVRDGRPIKVEGNPEHPISHGGLCSVAHGSLFSLYDADRPAGPRLNGRVTTWEALDAEVSSRLAALAKSGGKLRLLSSTVVSPSTQKLINRFLASFTEASHIVRDAVSYSGLREGHRRSHGRAAIPRYHLDKARLVVAFDADFLGTWLSPVGFASDYATARRLDTDARSMLRHIHFEPRLSLTGGNADQRFQISSSEIAGALHLLGSFVAAHAGGTTPPDATLTSGVQPATATAVKSAAEQLWEHRGTSVLMAGTNDPTLQALVATVNQTLGNYPTTIDIASPSLQSRGDDAAMDHLLEEMTSGSIAGLIVMGDANPLYDYHAADAFAAAVKKVPFTLSLNSTFDETSAAAGCFAPAGHYLEEWNDAEPVEGTLSITQPVIAPLFRSRPAQTSLLRWMGETRSWHDILQEEWRTSYFSHQSKHASFDDFWDSALHDGVFVPTIAAGATGGGDLSPTTSTDQPIHLSLDEAVAATVAKPEATATTGLGLILYEKVSIRDGRWGNNPWLQELPDPVSKVSWDNYALISPGLAGKLGVVDGDLVKLSDGKNVIELPARLQTGQNDDAVAVALGYGRRNAGRVGTALGANAFPFVKSADGTTRYHSNGIEIKKSSGRHELAVTQVHDSLEGRPLIHETSLAAFLSEHEKKGHEGKEHEEHESIWNRHDYPHHKWGMVVDLNACIGCSACMLSCQAENNIPVVGREEIARWREMYWIRIDRYYTGPSTNPSIAYQPVMCQQCDNASCESVCPVLATVHSTEGINMQVYNRCVGTRYCANNCPYKVRRFNWFEYDRSDPLASLALNPDVTVRSRGVMEKCTFCVQRIEETKIRTRNENRSITDGEILPACAQSCPTKAITFGDLLESKSTVNALKKNPRNYMLLDELNLNPALSYLGKVRNSEEG